MALRARPHVAGLRHAVQGRRRLRRHPASAWCGGRHRHCGGRVGRIYWSTAAAFRRPTGHPHPRAVGGLAGIKCARTVFPSGPHRVQRRATGTKSLSATPCASCALCRSRAAGARARAAAGYVGEGGHARWLSARQCHLLCAQAAAQHSFPRRLPIGHERWRLSTRRLARCLQPSSGRAQAGRPLRAR